MKAYKTFTSPTIIKKAFFSTLLLPGIFVCWQSLWMLLKDLSFSLSNTLFIVLSLLIVGFIPCFVVNLIIGRAFHPVIITEKGIRNGKTFLEWERIGFVQTIETKFYTDKVFKSIEIELICIARQQGEYSFNRNNNQCILIEKNLKNFDILAKYSQGKSLSIDSYLDRLFVQNTKD